jgi:hypothetical protein
MDRPFSVGSLSEQSSGPLPLSEWDWILSESGSELLYDWRFTVNKFVLAPSPFRHTTSIYFNWTLAVIALMKHPLWREVVSVVYNCFWTSPAQSSSGPSSTGLMTIFYCLRLETLQTWRARSPYLYPPGTGRPGYTPRHWVTFRRLLRLAGLRCRYSTPPPHGQVSSVCVQRLHNTSDRTEERTLSVTHKKFLSPPRHLGVSEVGSPLRQEGSGFQRRLCLSRAADILLPSLRWRLNIVSPKREHLV